MSAESTLARTPRWAKLLLVLSLAANLALLGLFGGALVGLRDGADAKGDERPRLPFLLRVLPESRHDEALALMEQSRGGPAREAARRAVAAEVVASIRAESFDRARLETAFADWAEAMSARRRTTRSQLVEMAERMTPEERLEMADRMEAMIERWEARRAARAASARTE